MTEGTGDGDMSLYVCMQITHTQLLFVQNKTKEMLPLSPEPGNSADNTSLQVCTVHNNILHSSTRT